MTSSDLNRETNMPHRVTLGDVLGSIEMTPGEMSTFLAQMAQPFQGGAHNNLYRLLTDHASLVADPRTYGYKPPEAAAAPGEQPYESPTAPRYAQRFGQTDFGGVAGEQIRPTSQNPSGNPAPDAPVFESMDANEPQRFGAAINVKQPAAQGQATTPQTLRTGYADASRDQGSADPLSASTPPVGAPGASIGGIPLSDDERRQYSDAGGQSSALDRAARRQKLQQEMDDLDRESSKRDDENRARHFDGSTWRYNDDNSEAPSPSSPGGFNVRSEATAPQDIP